MENKGMNINEAEFDLIKNFIEDYEADTEKVTSEFDSVDNEANEIIDNDEKGGGRRRWMPESKIIDWMAHSEAGILYCMKKLFYSLSDDIQDLHWCDIEKKVEVAKDILCSYSCKELAIADILNALACKIAVNKDLIKYDCDCDCEF